MNVIDILVNVALWVCENSPNFAQHASATPWSLPDFNHWALRSLEISHCPLSRKLLWIFSSNLPGNFAVKMAGSFSHTFSGSRRFPRNELSDPPQSQSQIAASGYQNFEVASFSRRNRRKKRNVAITKIALGKKKSLQFRITPL